MAIRDTDRGRILTRRAFVLGGMKLGLFGVLASRLYSLQVLQGDRYRTLADQNRISMRVLIPPRGIIIDRNGVILAHSRHVFRAELVQEQAQDVDETLKAVFALLPFEPWEKKRIARDLEKNRAEVPVLLRDNLSWNDLAQLELNMPTLDGVSIEMGETRQYPFGASTSHLLGYIGPPTEAEAKDNTLLSQPGFRIGKSGVEEVYDLGLRGEAGNVFLEVNAYGRPVRELKRREGVMGHELKLTLDINLQNFAQQRLTTEQSATAVVMDAVNGSVYALASHPTFDANLFTYGISKENWQRLNNDPLKPLINKAVMGLYAPGSTFKTVTALAALHAGINPNTSYFCPGHYNLGNHSFFCWKKGGHGTVDMKRAIIQSCDVYFYHVGQDLGIDPLYDMAKRLGLGEKLGIDLPHEKAGLVPNRAWKKQHFKESWQGGETLVATIGQGYMLATPLQLAVLSARLATGLAVKPHLLGSLKEVARAPETFPSLGLNPAHLEFVRQGMIGVCSPGGTAYGAHIPYPGYEMGAKTGTAQVRRISKAERSKGVIPNEKRPYEERDNALFIAFAPITNPRYVCAVVVEHGGGGSKVAGPIARDLLIEAQKRDPAGALPQPLVIPDDKKPGASQPQNTPPKPTPAPADDDDSTTDETDFTDFDIPPPEH